MARGAAMRRLSNGAQLHRAVPAYSGVDTDASGKFVRVVPLGSSLLHRLLNPVAVTPTRSEPPKRGRGRPRKVDAVAAKVWDEVTGGAGVVLADGEPVEVPKALK